MATKDTRRSCWSPCECTCSSRIWIASLGTEQTNANATNETPYQALSLLNQFKSTESSWRLNLVCSWWVFCSWDLPIMFFPDPSQSSCLFQSSFRRHEDHHRTMLHWLQHVLPAWLPALRRTHHSRKTVLSKALRLAEALPTLRLYQFTGQHFLYWTENILGYVSGLEFARCYTQRSIGFYIMSFLGVSRTTACKHASRMIPTIGSSTGIKPWGFKWKESPCLTGYSTGY